MATQLTDDTAWIGQCHEVDGRHMHISTYLVEAADGYVLIDSGSYNYETAISEQIEAETDGDGIDSLVLSHTDLPHVGNLEAFKQRWDDVDIIAATGEPGINGLSDATKKCTIGKDIELEGQPFAVIDPPLADRSHSVWLYDQRSEILYTVDGFGNFHDPPDCDLTTRTLENGVDAADIYEYHRTALRWLQYVDPALLQDALESLLDEYPVSWIAPVHGNPINGDDLEDYLERFTGAVTRIAGEYQPPQ